MKYGKKSLSKDNKKNNKRKLEPLEIVIRFFFGFLLPFLFINGIILYLYIQTPTINVVKEDSNDYVQDSIKFSVDSILPVTSIKTLKDNVDISYSKYGDYYTVDAKENGSYQIAVKILNGATANSYINIETKDTTPPVIDTSNAIISVDSITVYIMDHESEINYDNVYATTDTGEKEMPLSTDEKTGAIEFHYETGKKLVIHVEDVAGNYSEVTIN